MLGLAQILGLITALGGAMTTLTYVSRIIFDLISSRFKVCDMLSAYMSCMVGIKHLFGTIFKSSGSGDQNFGFFQYSAITLASGVRELSLRNGLVC